LEKYNNKNNDSTMSTATASSSPPKRKRGRPRKSQVDASTMGVSGGEKTTEIEAAAEEKDDNAYVPPQSSFPSLRKRKLPVDAPDGAGSTEGSGTSRATRMRKPSLRLRESREDEDAAIVSPSAGPARPQRISRTTIKKSESERQRGSKSEERSTQIQEKSKTKWIFDGVFIEGRPSKWLYSEPGKRGPAMDGIEWSEEDAPYEMEGPSTEFNWDNALGVANALSRALLGWHGFSSYFCNPVSLIWTLISKRPNLEHWHGDIFASGK
jgi:hypothetical protein